MGPQSGVWQTLEVRWAWSILLLVACDAGACRSVADAPSDACEEACDDGEAMACARIAAFLEDPRADSADHARPRWRQACAHADADERWLCAIDDAPPDAAERRALDEACRAGEPVACWGAARHVSVSIPMAPPTAEPEREPDPTIELRADATSLTVDGEPTTVAELAAMTFDEGTRAVLAVDREMPHARFIEVVDALRAAGVTRHAINVNPTDVSAGDGDE